MSNGAAAPQHEPPKGLIRRSLVSSLKTFDENPAAFIIGTAVTIVTFAFSFFIGGWQTHDSLYNGVTTQTAESTDHRLTVTSANPAPGEVSTSRVNTLTFALNADLPNGTQLWLAHRETGLGPIGEYQLSPVPCSPAAAPRTYDCSKIEIGREGDSGIVYNLYLVAADADASEIFRSHLAGQKAASPELGNLINDLLPAGTDTALVYTSSIVRQPQE